MRTMAFAGDRVFAIVFVLSLHFSTVKTGGVSPPAWSTGTETTSVSEGVAVGTAVTVTTTVINSAVTISILGTSTGADAQTLFSVATDGTNVQLTTAGDLDRETTAQFVLHLRATNAGGDTSTEANYGDLELTIDVTDVNDNNPVFSTASTCSAMSANAAGSTAVATLAATDADSTSTLMYTFSAAQTYFDVGSSTGAVTVKSTQTLSAGSYNMQVVASDGGMSPATATLTVCAGSTCCSSCSDGCSSSGVEQNTAFSAIVLFTVILLLKYFV